MEYVFYLVKISKLVKNKTMHKSCRIIRKYHAIEQDLVGQFELRNLVIKMLQNLR